MTNPCVSVCLSVSSGGIRVLQADDDVVSGIKGKERGQCKQLSPTEEGEGMMQHTRPYSHAMAVFMCPQCSCLTKCSTSTRQSASVMRKGEQHTDTLIHTLTHTMHVNDHKTLCVLCAVPIG